VAAFRSGLADKAAVLSVFAVLLKKTESKVARQNIYSQWQELTRDPEDFFLFLEFHTRVKGGWGAGLRRQLTGWYEKQVSRNCYCFWSGILCFFFIQYMYRYLVHV
jgi:hypothetical protein